MVLLPRLLTGNDRRLHVRQTLREDHRTRIAQRNEEVEAKFDKLAGSVSTFFRGCGRSLAHAHALSDESGRIDHDVEPPIVQAIGDADLFVDDIVRFALDAAARAQADHAHFVADHELGGFRTVDVAYR